MLCLAIFALLASTLAPSLAAQEIDPFSQPGEHWDHVGTLQVDYYVQPNSEVSAQSFVDTYGSEIDMGLEELLLFLNATGLEQPLSICVYTDSNAFQTDVASVQNKEFSGMVAVADPLRSRVDVLLDPFIALTSLEAENQLRHALSHIVAGWATSNKIPRGFDEGLAQYVERPNQPEQARLAAIVQTDQQHGKLASWSNLNRSSPLDDEELVKAETYSVVAYLIKHHGLPEFWTFLKELNTADTWRDTMNVAFAPATSDNIERQWKDDVPLWASGDWRWNLVAGFDLRPAQEQLRRGNFKGAASTLAVSEQLLRDIKDPARSAEVTRLKDQARIGELAEAKMVEAQQALEQFVYDRAAAAVAQADEQYKQLPAELRPGDLIETYSEMAQRGLQATQDLEIARIRAGNWGDYPDARSSALSAGTSFASLGDEELRTQSDSLISQMDQEQLRLVLLLAALALLTSAWLGLWLWSRGPSTAKWD